MRIRIDKWTRTYRTVAASGQLYSLHILPFEITHKAIQRLKCVGGWPQPEWDGRREPESGIAVGLFTLVFRSSDPPHCGHCNLDLDHDVLYSVARE